jgi:hypothetical protein
MARAGAQAAAEKAAGLSAQMLIKWRKLGLRHREYTARVVYLLLLAIPFAALALLSLFAFLGVLAVRWIVSLAGAARYLAKRRSDMA